MEGTGNIPALWGDASTLDHVAGPGVLRGVPAKSSRVRLHSLFVDMGRMYTVRLGLQMAQVGPQEPHCWQGKDYSSGSSSWAHNCGLVFRAQEPSVHMGARDAPEGHGRFPARNRTIPRWGPHFREATAVAVDVLEAASVGLERERALDHAVMTDAVLSQAEAPRLQVDVDLMFEVSRPNLKGRCRFDR